MNSRELGSILNNDINNILYAGSGPKTTPDEYKKAVMHLLDTQPGELDIYDFGREHKNLAIPGRGCLDPIHSEVFQHRMEVFTEVANEYDIDSIEFDFRRWYWMLSEPHKNHPVLTRMVAETRAMLDEVAERKACPRLLFGARVGPMLDGPFRREDFPGASQDAPTNQSCADLGVDVRTWVQEGLVDYLSPTLFWPRWPGLPRTEEFVELTRGTEVGIYPTLWPLPTWIDEGPPLEPDDRQGLLRYKTELCRLALQLYEEGADGISTFNWMPHHQPGMVANPMRQNWGLGAIRLQMHIHSLLSDRVKLEDYLKSDVVLPE